MCVDGKVPLNVAPLKLLVPIVKQIASQRTFLIWILELPDLHTLILNSSQKLPIAFTGEKEEENLYAHL